MLNFVVVICSWYPFRSLALRILLLGVFRRLFTMLLVVVPVADRASFVFSEALYFALCLLLSTGVLCEMGPPLEVSWLPAHKKIAISANAAMTRMASCGSASSLQDSVSPTDRHNRSWKLIRKRCLGSKTGSRCCLAFFQHQYIWRPMLHAHFHFTGHYVSLLLRALCSFCY